MQVMQEAATQAAGGSMPGFYLFADLPVLTTYEDLLALPWPNMRGDQAVLAASHPAGSNGNEASRGPGN